ncbi:MAG TPA: helix-turn-helix domain-containing protein [Anaerolineae bacterium]|nr:helix-turn-helix domain-containing protein [Anaerolineae bacterium]
MATGRKPKPLAGDQGRATISDGQLTDPSLPYSESVVKRQNHTVSDDNPDLRGKANLKGFTPIIDVVVKDTSFMTAVVFGVVWRHCQMDLGACIASLETLAGTIGVGRKTVVRHVKELVKLGYLRDLTPERRNAPHVYVDTGKVAALIEVRFGKTESPTKVGQRVPLGGSESPTKVGQRVLPRWVRESLEETIEETNKDTTEETAAAGFSLKEGSAVTCSIHDCPMEQRSKGGAIWFSHRLADGSWCKGGPTDVQEPHVAERSRYAAQFYLVQADA